MESMKDQRIAAFLTLDDGFGSGSGSGSGDVLGLGYGFGYGSGSGSGSGSGCGSSSDYGSGDGSGYGDGDGSGSCWGLGDGTGSGYGFSSIIKSFCGSQVYMIDGIPTIIDRVTGEIAKGRILKDDLTTTPCFVVKCGGYFAHGDTLRHAMEALRDKQFEDMPEDEWKTTEVAP